jgi:hypothetical protein
MMHRMANSNRALLFASVLTVLSMPAINSAFCSVASMPALLEVRIGYHLAAGNMNTAAILIQERNHSVAKQRS